MDRRRKAPRQQTDSKDTAKGCGCLVLLALLVIGGLGSCGRDTPTTPVAGSPVATTAPRAAPTSTAPPPVGEVVTVTGVIDGDTFRVGDRTIRVLAIEACEAETYGGEQALQSARSSLTNPYDQPVTLTTEPGVDRDRSGRELRYVSINGADFAEQQVKYEHTGMLASGNGASPAYVSRLTAADTEYSTEPGVGRTCSGPEPAPTGANDTDVDVEIDDDDDGGESRFCRGRWYC